MTSVLRTIAITAFLALVATLLGLGPASADETADPAAPTSAVGECHNISFKQADEHTLTAAAVSCTRAHTALVTAVPLLPAALTWKSAPAKIQIAVGTACTRASTKLIGANVLQRFRSQYTWLWFEPTDAQKAAGARWFTCHLAVAEDSRFAPLPTAPAEAQQEDAQRRVEVPGAADGLLHHLRGPARLALDVRGVRPQAADQGEGRRGL